MSEPRITIPSQQLYELCLVLAEAGKSAVGSAPPAFASGWLACCKAIDAIADEQARKERGDEQARTGPT